MAFEETPVTSLMLPKSATGADTSPLALLDLGIGPRPLALRVILFALPLPPRFLSKPRLEEGKDDTVPRRPPATGLPRRDLRKEAPPSPMAARSGASSQPGSGASTLASAAPNMTPPLSFGPTTAMRSRGARWRCAAVAVALKYVAR